MKNRYATFLVWKATNCCLNHKSSNLTRIGCSGFLDVQHDSLKAGVSKLRPSKPFHPTAKTFC